jgi:pimeloyl-ACP methyl ester carboxylesterase
MFKSAEGEAAYLAAYDAALAEWPQPYDTLEVEGRFGCTHIHAAGPKDAPPLFLLHGYGFTSAMWAPNVAALSREHRVYAPDTLGDMGRSVATKMPANAAEYAAWLGGVFDELGVDQADVAGLSYGGWIAVSAALFETERVRRLVAMDPAASLLPLVRSFYIRAIVSMLVPGHALLYDYVRWMTSRRSPLGSGDVSRQPVVRQFAIGFKQWKMEGGTSPTVFTDDELRAIRTPTLLMMGEDEVIYSPTRAIERARRLISNLQVEVIPRAGHSISLEQPEIVNEHLLKFLA